MLSLSPSTVSFIRQHRMEDVRMLALQAAKYPEVDMSVALRQIAGWQVARVKLPLWAETEGLYYPPHLSLEQCSSELTARYKAGLLSGETLVDLTGGFGVDCAFLSSAFRSVTYVERQIELCRIATHNFPLLGLPHVQVVNAEATDYLRTMQPVDCIYLDPARRDGQGSKVIAVADCEPNVAELESLLLQKAGKILVKLSPMLDLSQALRVLPHTQELHVVAVDNECKELLVLLASTPPERVPVHCVNLSDGVTGDVSFTFTREGEQNCECHYASIPASYLYEPNAALMKAGGYKSIAVAYGLDKLHPNTHLYTSDTLIPHFPGRVFRVVSFGGFGKREQKSLLGGLQKANISVRNFPASVAELRKRTKLSDGGDTYLFAATLYSDAHVLIRCEKL